MNLPLACSPVQLLSAGYYIGNMPERSESDLPATYAIGDLHGEVTLLRQLLTRLPIGEQNTLVFLGDYMHRGEDTLATITLLLDLAQTQPACVFLRGNHEDAWLDYWDGTRFEQPPELTGAQEVWDAFRGVIPTEVGRWIEATQIEYEDEHGYYVHAGVLPDEPVCRTPDEFKLWGAKGFFETNYDWGKPVVFGHREVREPLLQPNKIGIDTGAYRTGVLSAVRLPDRAIFQARR